MPFPQQIQIALNNYDQQKGFFRRLFGDHPAIKALRKLTNEDQQNFFKITQCFIEHQPKPSRASHRVYRSVLAHLNTHNLNGIPKVLEQLYSAKLLTAANWDALTNTAPNCLRMLAYVLEKLNTNRLLTEPNFTRLVDTPNGLGIIAVAPGIDTLQINQQLTQENIDSLFKKPEKAANIAAALEVLAKTNLLTTENRAQLLNPANSFLISNEAYTQLWRDPPKLFNQPVFDQLISCAQQENPELAIQHYCKPGLTNLDSQRTVDHSAVTISDSPPQAHRETLSYSSTSHFFPTQSINLSEAAIMAELKVEDSFSPVSSI